jgi:hypothetical protein
MVPTFTADTQMFYCLLVQLHWLLALWHSSCVQRSTHLQIARHLQLIMRHSFRTAAHTAFLVKRASVTAIDVSNGVWQ